MFNRKRPRKNGKPIPGRGIKLARNKNFEPVIETDSGVKVRSKYEKECADYLNKNGIKFQYEPLMLIGGQKFRPDFYLPDYNLFLEICGYNHMPFYGDNIIRKEKIYQKYGLRTVFLRFSGQGSLEKKLSEELSKFVDKLRKSQG